VLKPEGRPAPRRASRRNPRSRNVLWVTARGNAKPYKKGEGILRIAANSQERFEFLLADGPA